MAYEFTAASSQYLSTAIAPVTATPLTMACWNIRPTAALQILLAISDEGNANTRYSLSAGSTSGAFVIAHNGTTSGTATIGSPLTNAWAHAAGVFTSPTSRTVYLNGSFVTNTTTVSDPASLDNLTIGARRNSSVLNLFTGSVAEVGIWNVALTAEEVASLADGMTCDKVRPQSLVFYAPLVRDLIDYKGGLTITNNNTATVANHPRVYA